MEKALRIFFLVSLPLLFWATMLVLPTFDDWTYSTTPFFGSLTVSDLLPTGSYWRPFDAILGAILSLNYYLFPSLNHILVFLGHTASAYLIYRLTQKNIIATLFFYLSAATLGAIFDTDSMNQVYAQLWGLASLCFYNRDKKACWIACVVVATLCKENGIVFFAIPIILQWGKQPGYKADRTAVVDILKAGIAVVIYAVARLALAPSTAEINGQYLNNGLLDHVKDLVQLLAYVFLPVDYVSVVYPPARNLLLLGITFMLILPFLCVVLRQLWSCRKDKYAWTLLFCCLVAASPHLVTLVSIMNCYSALGMASLLIGYLTKDLTRTIYMAFLPYLAAAAFTFWHHWHEAYLSGLLGKEMAVEILSKEKTQPKTVFLIQVDGNESKYSTFCVTPYDAFGWGRAACHESEYTIATDVKDTLIGPYDTGSAKVRDIQHIVDSVKAGNHYDAVWQTEGKHVSVIYDKQKK